MKQYTIANATAIITSQLKYNYLNDDKVVASTTVDGKLFHNIVPR